MMNEKQMREILETAATQITPDARFTSELEEKLIKAHKTKERFFMFKNKNLISTLGFIGAIALLLLALNWAFRSLAPKTIPGAGKTPSPTQSLENTPSPISTLPADYYNFRGSKLFLKQPLPESPANANVYLLNKDQPATLDEARALAQQFGIQSEVYISPAQIPNTTDYVFTDGKQMLTFRSNFYFTYVADILKNNSTFAGVANQNPNAEATITTFLKSHGFDFPVKVEADDIRGGYLVRQLAPDGIPVQYESLSIDPLQVKLDDNGQVLWLQASLMGFNQTPVGAFGIISADEALKKMLDDTVQAGKIEGFISAPQPVKEWRHDYPVNQPMTLYGFVSLLPALDSSKPPFIQVDNYVVSGNVDGLDTIKPGTYVEATGQFVIENEIQKFRIDSWKASDKSGDDGLTGTLHRDGTKVILSSADKGDLTLIPDVPSDLPLPFEKAFVIGTVTGNTFMWKSIDNRMALGQGGGGGGGGGGLGFYQLNLSGTPMPFPAATAIPTKALGIQYTIKATDTLSKIASEFGISVDTLTQANNISDPSMVYVGQVLTIPGTIPQPTVGQKIEKLHGTISIIVHKKTDGSQQTEYNLFTSNNQFPHILLEGADTQVLQDNNARPADVWGTVDRFAQDGTPVVKVDQLEISYPGLKFQILRGTQKSAEVQGQPVIIFTADDGTSYVQVNPDGTPDTMLTAGQIGDQILLEALAIPDEKFGDYPAIHGYQASMAINPKNGQSMEMQITADQPQVMDEAQTQQLPPGATPPANLTIEKVELVYYVSNPLYQGSDINASKHLPYIQPAWHFSGRYSNGDKFDMLIQALKQEFLSPEVLPVIPPG